MPLRLGTTLGAGLVTLLRLSPDSDSYRLELDLPAGGQEGVDMSEPIDQLLGAEYGNLSPSNDRLSRGSNYCVPQTLAWRKRLAI